MIDLRFIQTLVNALRRLRYRPALYPARPKSTLVGRYLGMLTVLLLVGATAVQAQVSGISYTVSPIGQRINWEGDAALDNGFFYGGELGFGFGEYVELSAVYLRGDNFDTNFSDLSGDSLAALGGVPSRQVDIQRYGGRLRLNVGSGRIVPFIMGGTGIMRFSPDDLDASESIYAEAGVGITFSVANRYTLSLAAQGLAYRYNPGTAFLSDDDLAAVQLTRDAIGRHEVFNPAFSAALKFYLGGRAQDEMTDVDRAFISQFRGGNFRLAVEPFYGQIDFNNDLNLPSQQRVAGVNAGVDLGPYLGLRGFYWRVVDDGSPTDFQNIAFYGGDLDFRFQRELGGNITPYLIFGGGYMDIDSEAYAEETGFTAESRYFATAGGGLEIPLSSALKLQGGVRALLMSKEDVEDLSEPSSVFSSFMYTAGLNFNLGGGGTTAGTIMGRDVAAARAEARDRDATMERQLAVIQARLDSLEAARAAMPANEAMPTDEAMPADEAAMTTTAATQAQPSYAVQRDTVVVETPRRSNLSGQTLTIPVPEEGEIYIRFGAAQQTPVETTYAPPMIVGMVPQMMGMAQATPASMTATTPEATSVRIDTTAGGGLTIEQIRQIVQQAMAEQQQPQGLTAEELEESLRRLEDRIERRLERESRLLRDEMNDQPREPQGTAASPARADSAGGGVLGSLGTRQLVAVHPLIGLRLGEGPTQFLIGARGDYRFSRRSFRFLPEVALGIGDKVAVNAFGNIAWDFGRIGPLRPYAGPGVGFISDSGLSGLELAFNLMAGAEYTTLGGGTFFGEYSTLDFFKVSRLLVGYRLRF